MCILLEGWSKDDILSDRLWKYKLIVCSIAVADIHLCLLEIRWKNAISYSVCIYIYVLMECVWEHMQSFTKWIYYNYITDCVQDKKCFENCVLNRLNSIAMNY